MTMDAREWAIEVTTEYERAVLHDLDAYQQEILDAAIRGVLAVEGHGVCRSSWGKPLGGGLYEFRIQKSSKKQVMRRVDPGYQPVPGDDRTVTLRAMFTTRGRHLILLLTAYDKGGNPSRKQQQQVIGEARSIAAHLGGKC